MVLFFILLSVGVVGLALVLARKSKTASEKDLDSFMKALKSRPLRNTANV